MYVDSARWENLSVEAKGDYFVLWSRQWFKFFYIKTVTGHALKNKNQQCRSRITDWTYTDCFWCKMTEVQSAWLLCAGWSVVLHSNWLLRCCLVAHDPGLFWGDWYHLVLWQVLFTLSYKKRMHFKRPAATYKKFKHLCVLWRCFPNKISTGVQCVLERRIVLDVLHNVLVISDASLDTWQLANMNFVCLCKTRCQTFGPWHTRHDWIGAQHIFYRLLVHHIANPHFCKFSPNMLFHLAGPVLFLK